MYKQRSRVRSSNTTSAVLPTYQYQTRAHQASPRNKFRSPYALPAEGRVGNTNSRAEPAVLFSIVTITILCAFSILVLMLTVENASFRYRYTLLFCRIVSSKECIKDICAHHVQHAGTLASEASEHDNLAGRIHEPSCPGVNPHSNSCCTLAVRPHPATESLW